MNKRTIYITSEDRQHLGDLIAEEAARSPRDQARLKELEGELARAHIVESRNLPPTVVTMNSKVKLRDLDAAETFTYTLVFPDTANADEGRISVVSPIGTAILGYEEGDTISWQVPSGKRRIRIEKVLYQPEAAGAAPPGSG